MKLAYIYPHNEWNAWSLGPGAVEALERMGHTVLPVGHKDGWRFDDWPTLQTLDEQDGVIINGPEHLADKLLSRYPGWPLLKPPVVGWLMESVNRTDYGQLNIDGLKTVFKNLFCPAPQDEQFGMKYLPFGVDLEMFHQSEEVKRHKFVSLGHIYPSREAFLKQLYRFKIPPITMGKCLYTDLDGFNFKESAIIYARELRQTDVFVCLPSLSDLMVAKVFEALASGCVVITSSPPTELVRKMLPFWNGIHILYYNSSDPADLARCLHWMDREPDLKERIRAGGKTIIQHCSIESRLQVLVEALKK